MGCVSSKRLLCPICGEPLYNYFAEFFRCKNGHISEFPELAIEGVNSIEPN